MRLYMPNISDSVDLYLIKHNLEQLDDTKYECRCSDQWMIIIWNSIADYLAGQKIDYWSVLECWQQILEDYGDVIDTNDLP